MLTREEFLDKSKQMFYAQTLDETIEIADELKKHDLDMRDEIEKHKKAVEVLLKDNIKNHRGCPREECGDYDDCLKCWREYAYKDGE